MHLRSRFLLCSFLFCSLCFESFAQEIQTRVLIFTKTTGFRHASIGKGVSALEIILKDAKIQTVHTEDASYFNADSLHSFDAVVFLNTTGTILAKEQKLAFEKYIQTGHGFVGIHAASDTEYEWPWYGNLVGGYFSSHPEVQEAAVKVLDRKHPSTKHLEQVWVHRDEWYDFKDVKAGLHFLMEVDESSYNGGKMGKFHPVAWFHNYDGGRSFYTALGHTDEVYDEPKFLKHVLGGIKYAIGEK